MSTNTLQDFIEYCNKHIKGDEKGEAQIFLDHFFKALEYEDGLKGAGAECEFRIRNEEKKSTSFADLVWKERVLIEMKKRGEDLSEHLKQAQNYWMDLTPKPPYVILCNFDEFWIYDFNKKVYEPLDKVPLLKIAEHKEAFNFLLPQKYTPVFGNDWEAVTKDAAYLISNVYRLLKKRGIAENIALNYILQSVIAMYSEDTKLLPHRIFTQLIEECEVDHKKTYDLIGGLFREMNNPGVTPVGIYKGVEYFNGGLFKEVNALELTEHETNLLAAGARKDWSKVNPAIFGGIFEGGMEEEERHKLGAHYTSEADIKMIVYPVIVKPWLEKIENAEMLDELYDLLTELRNFKVLDPACGSGNFLFVAFNEMKGLEKKLLGRVRAISTKKEESKRLQKFLLDNKYVSTKQFFGMDMNPYAVEIAKVTLMVAKELSIKEQYDNEHPLPLDNLDKNIIRADALFTEWPEADAIIGNPPFQSKNKMQDEFGGEYVNKLHETYPEVPGRADFCVYWFYKAHKHLKPNSYAGLVGTNTIRQNYSREGSLDYIVKNGGTIIEAVSSERWSGDAAVHVSIACWKKGEFKNTKIIYTSDKENKLHPHKVTSINSSLSLQTDVTSAKVLESNKEPKKCFQGQTHGHKGFLLSVKEGKKILKDHPDYSKVLKPFLIGDEMISNIGAQPSRFVIDFTNCDIVVASKYKELYKIVEKEVYPKRKEESDKQEKENEELLKKNKNARINKHHLNFFKYWWNLSYGREDMLDTINDLSRYISCSQVSKRQIFEFISIEIRPNAALMVFAFEDDYSFGILQSSFHWKWYEEKCSTLGEQLRYTTTSIWDTFPWPQEPTQKQIEKVAKASKALRDARNEAMKNHVMALLDLYRVLEKGGHKINDLQKELDNAVLDAYGFDEKKDWLGQLLELNLTITAKEKQKQPVQVPGLPEWVKDKKKYISDDCVKFEAD